MDEKNKEIWTKEILKYLELDENTYSKKNTVWYWDETIKKLKNKKHSK